MTDRQDNWDGPVVVAPAREEKTDPGSPELEELPGRSALSRHLQTLRERKHLEG